MNNNNFLNNNNNNNFFNLNNNNNNNDNDWDEEPTQVHLVESSYNRGVWEQNWRPIDDFSEDSHDCYYDDNKIQCDNISSTTTRIVSPKDLVNTCIVLNMEIPATTEEYLEYMSMLSDSDQNHYQQFTKSQNLGNREFKLKLKTAYEQKEIDAAVSPSFYVKEYEYDHENGDSNCECTETHHCVFTTLKCGKTKLYLPKQPL
jgi:hypothetical protein